MNATTTATQFVTSVTACATAEGGGLILCFGAGPTVYTHTLTFTTLSSGQSAPPMTFNTSYVWNGVDVSTFAPRPTASTQLNSPTKTRGLQPGIIAAAVLGSIVGLAILIELLILTYRRHRSERQPTSERAQAMYALLSQNRKPQKPRRVPAQFASLLDALSTPAIDEEVRQRLSKVLSQLGRFVADCYEDVELELDSKLQTQLALFETAHLPERLPYCFTITKRPTQLIQHCLSFHVINLTLSPGTGTHPLLPKDIAPVVAKLHPKVISEKCPQSSLTNFEMADSR